MVCVRPEHVFACREEFTSRSPESVATVVGFPFGATHTAALLEEVKYVRDYVTHIDMVLDINAFHAGRFVDVSRQIKEIRELASEENLRVIVETGYLNDFQIQKATELVLDCKAEYIKTCTGYGPRGVSVNDVQLMKAICGDDMKIKASGGIRTYEFACDLIKAGADVLGTSSGVKLIEEQEFFLN